jgi:hypothetical protein
MLRHQPSTVSGHVELLGDGRCLRGPMQGCGLTLRLLWGLYIGLTWGLSTRALGHCGAPPSIHKAYCCNRLWRCNAALRKRCCMLRQYGSGEHSRKPSFLRRRALICRALRCAYRIPWRANHFARFARHVGMPAPLRSCATCGLPLASWHGLVDHMVMMARRHRQNTQATASNGSQHTCMDAVTTQTTVPISNHQCVAIQAAFVSAQHAKAMRM